MLRIGGVDLDPERVLRLSGLAAYRIDRKGELGLLKDRGPYTKSVVHVDVSSADFDDFEGQVADAIAFLHANEASLRAAISFSGFEWAMLDFAVSHADVAIDCKYLNPEILSLAGNLGLGIEISIYPWTPSEKT